MSEEHFLNQIFKSSDLTGDSLELIISKFKRVTFDRNDYLLSQGNSSNHYWYIESGFVRSFVIDHNGNDITTNFYTKGEIVIDWSSFFLRNRTRENIQSLTSCICWQLDFETFQQLFHNIRSFREQGRSRLVTSYFALKNQSISMIADDAKTRYNQLIIEKPYIIQNVPLKYIASYLGITDTSLSRIRKKASD